MKYDLRMNKKTNNRTVKKEQKFLFGVSTAATQIEGAYDADGKGKSVWDYYSEEGLIQNGHTCYTCCDSYNRLEEDLDLIRDLGVDSYRFSISWTRLQPAGRGEVNEKGIAYYNRLIDGLLEMGVKPMVTLFHWDLPMTLYQEGGFLNRDIVERFAEYGRIIGERFGDRVEMFSVFNEPQALIDFLYARPVGGKSEPRSNQEIFEAIHTLLLCNAAATYALRKYASKPVKVGLVNCTQIKVPKTPEDIDAARNATFAVGDTILGNNVTFWEPIAFGRYDERMIEKFEINLSFVQEGEMKYICCKPDFMGCNIYCGERVARGEKVAVAVPLSLNASCGDMGGDFIDTADCMYWGTRFMYERYKLPIYVTENGCTMVEWKTRKGTVEDAMRDDYIHRYFTYLWKAREEGVDIRGYYVWTLMDNFEWSSGFSRRFGLVYVDFETGERTKKKSFYGYKEMIEEFHQIEEC